MGGNSTVLSTCSWKFKSPFPAHDAPRKNEDLATNQIFSDALAIDCGHTIAQFFSGCSAGVADIIGIAKKSDFPKTLQDMIHFCGAHARLMSDSDVVETSANCKDVLRCCHIGEWQSAPYQHHQNPAERRHQDAKRITN